MLADEKDSERQKLQKGLRKTTAQCAADVDDILHGKMCALQRVRDGLQLMAGRNELPEDCQVSDWDKGSCSATCGGGVRTLTREVVLTPKGGADCPPLKMAAQCADTVCPMDCEVSQWSSWSACTAMCDGGVQERNRAVSKAPQGNGVACPHLVDVRLCNSEACTSECDFLEWSPWSPCSKACGGGSQSRARGLQDAGRASCPKSDSQERLEHRSCNAEGCGQLDNVTCAGNPMDIVILVDVSGSVTQVGVSALTHLSQKLTSHFAPSAEGNQIAVATFAKQVTTISRLSGDLAELTSRLSSGFPPPIGSASLGSALTQAGVLLSAGGRRRATSMVLVITDGRVVDPFLARTAAERLKDNGARLAFALLGSDYKNHDLLKSLASTPSSDNLFSLPPASALEPAAESSAKSIVVGSCAALR